MFKSFRFMLVFVNRMMQIIEQMWDNKILSREKMGGYLCILDADTGDELLLCPIGSMLAHNIAKYRNYAKEKANRLFELSQSDKNQWSSWQSRDEANEKWGGAVRSANLIFSFSGFPQLVDEAFMLMLAIEFDEMPDGVAEIIAQMSSNEPFKKSRALLAA